MLLKLVKSAWVIGKIRARHLHPLLLWHNWVFGCGACAFTSSKQETPLAVWTPEFAWAFLSFRQTKNVNMLHDVSRLLGKSAHVLILRRDGNFLTQLTSMLCLTTGKSSSWLPAVWPLSSLHSGRFPGGRSALPPQHLLSTTVWCSSKFNQNGLFLHECLTVVPVSTTKS